MRIKLTDDRLACRKLIRKNCVESPGIYAWLDVNRTPVYVGKSKSLKHRLLSYFHPQPGVDKVRRIRQQSVELAWQPISHELLALFREQELINRFRPTFNVQGVPQRRQPAFLVLTHGSAPKLLATKNVPTKVSAVFGPVPGAGRLRETALVLNHVFKLRDCAESTPLLFNDQLRLFDDDTIPLCMRHELNTCLGPCAGKCSRGSYSDFVKETLRFLNGYDRSILSQMIHEMNEASATRQYERAARHRDDYQQLTWLDQRLESLRIWRYELNCVYPLRGFGSRNVWLFLNAARLSECMAEPADAETSRQAIEGVDRLSESAGRDNIPRRAMETEMQLILLRWFRKNPDERNQLISTCAARTMCDGIIKRGSPAQQPDAGLRSNLRLTA